MSNEKSWPRPRVDLRALFKVNNVTVAPQVQNRRLFVLLVLSFGINGVLAVGLAQLAPLKEKIPYMVDREVDHLGVPTGRVSVSNRQARNFVADEKNIRYFLREWAVNIASIDELSRGYRLPSSYAYMKGQGLKDWRSYIGEQSRTLEKLTADPTYRQKAEIITTTLLTDETALIRVKLTDTKGMEKRVLVTATFILIPMDGDKDESRNPIGLWITNFNVNDELA